MILSHLLDFNLFASLLFGWKKEEKMANIFAASVQQILVDWNYIRFIVTMKFESNGRFEIYIG